MVTKRKTTSTEERLQQSFPKDIRRLPAEEIVGGQTLSGGQSRPPSGGGGGGGGVGINLAEQARRRQQEQLRQAQLKKERDRRLAEEQRKKAEIRKREQQLNIVRKRLRRERLFTAQRIRTGTGVVTRQEFQRRQRNVDIKRLIKRADEELKVLKKEIDIIVTFK